MSIETTVNNPAEELIRLLQAEDKLPDDYTCYVEQDDSFTTVYAITSIVTTIVNHDPVAAVTARRFIPM